MKKVGKLIIYGLITIAIALTIISVNIYPLTATSTSQETKLKQSAERIALIEQRLAVTEDRIDYTNKKKWTNYISTNPVDIIQNLFGGGGVQRDRIAITELEIRTTDLLAAKAELERQQAEEKIDLGERILKLLLDYEAATRELELLKSQLETLQQQKEVTRIAYRVGRSSTEQILNLKRERARITGQIVEIEIEQNQSKRHIERITGG